MEQTARFQIPLLAPGQAQKEFFHNEALERISTLLCPVVEGAPQAAPPVNPAIGATYLVGVGGAGAWSGQDDAIACFTAGGWRFITPIEGLSVISRPNGEPIQWRSGAWEAGIARLQEVRIDGQTVLRERQPAIQNPVGGTVIDSECRGVLATALSALRAHGLIA
jgi:hypothetical protein